MATTNLIAQRHLFSYLGAKRRLLQGLDPAAHILRRVRTQKQRLQPALRARQQHLPAHTHTNTSELGQDAIAPETSSHRIYNTTCKGANAVTLLKRRGTLKQLRLPVSGAYITVQSFMATRPDSGVGC